MKKKISQGEYLLEIREKYVTKSNELIQKSRFNLTAEQQKILLSLIAQVQKNDDEFKIYEFSLSEFLKLCGSEKGGNSYERLKADIKTLADKSFWITLYDETRKEPVEKLLRWIDTAEIMPKSDTVRLSLHRDMRPFLLNLRRNFTEFQLLYTLQFRSKYSIRLYEIICSLHYDVFKPYEFTYTVDELRKMLGAETYTLIKPFKLRVMNPAITEINAYSDKLITAEYIKKSGKVTHVKLHIETKPMLDRDKIRADLDRKFKVDEQQSLWILMDNARGAGNNAE